MTELYALVVGGVDYGDADRVVHLLTHNGRLAAFAHGAKKSKKRFAGSLEPFSTIRCTMSPRASHGMPSMTQATVERARLPLRDDLSKIALASYVVELSSKVAPEALPADSILELAERTLDRLVEAAKVNMAHRRAFELRLVDALGYRPRTDACLVCGTAAAEMFLDLSAGGVLCALHRTTGRAIGPKTIAWMEQVFEFADRGDEEVGLGPEHADRAARALGPTTAAFFHGLLPKPLASLALLETLAL